MRRQVLGLNALIGAILLSGACQFDAHTASPPSINTNDLVSGGFSYEGVNAIQEMMNSAVEEKRIPSAIAMLARDGEIIWIGTAGDMGPGVPMSREAIVPLASVGKIYTATAALILIERGVIAFDDPVSEYIPEFADVKINVAGAEGSQHLVAPKSPITVRHLLTHTSGLIVDGDEFWNAWNANTDKTTATHMARDLAALPLEYHPGQGYNYGPTGAAYEVLGAIIEIASGQTLEAFMIKNIFEPLELDDSFFYVPDDKVHLLPAFYSKRNGPMELSRPYAKEFARSKYFFGGGGVSASPEDILRFARLFIDLGSVDGAKILKAETVQQMMTDQIGDLAPDSWKDRGLSWGFGAAVKAASSDSKSGLPDQYGWVGGGYAKMWVDPKYRMVAYFAFPLEPPGNNALLNEFEQLVYSAIQ